MQTTVSMYFIVPGIKILWGITEICKMLGRHAVLFVSEWLYSYWSWVIIVLQRKSVLYANKNMTSVLFLCVNPGEEIFLRIYFFILFQGRRASSHWASS